MRPFRVFEYMRGDGKEWSVGCVVNGADAITFFNQKYPAGASDDVKADFLEEAETAVLKKLNSKEGTDG